MLTFLGLGQVIKVKMFYVLTVHTSRRRMWTYSSSTRFRSIASHGLLQ